MRLEGSIIRRVFPHRVAPRQRVALGVAALLSAVLLIVALALVVTTTGGGSLALEAKPAAESGNAGAAPGDCGTSLAIQPPYDSTYSCTSLGGVPGLPPNYGGLVFLHDDPNTLLIGGSANTGSGTLYRIGVQRDGTGHITGFSGEVARVADAAFNDGGIVYGPDGILFLARWPENSLGQTRPGSAITDKIIDLSQLVCPALSALNFVPAGFPGAGQLKLVTYGGGCWYTAGIEPDGNGLFNVTSTVSETTITGGPEGFIYVPPGSPIFPNFDSMLIAEYSGGNIATYNLDDNGDPDPSSRAVFISGLSGAEGAAIDPLTGDFLFSTFGGSNQVVAIRGFAAPPTPTSTGEPATPTQTSTAVPVTTPVSPTATATLVPATATATLVQPTATPPPPTATRTPIPPTATRTLVPSPTSPATATPSATPRPTRTPTPFVPPTAVPTSTLPPTATPPATATSAPSSPDATATAEALAAIAGANSTAEARSAGATATALSVEVTATAEIAAATATSQAEAKATATSEAATVTARAPTPTRESNVLGAVTPAGPSGGGGGAHVPRPVFGVSAGQPKTTAAVLGLDQVSRNPKVVGTNIVLAIILLLVLLFSSTVFNETISEHRLELQGYAMRLTAPLASLGERVRGLSPAGLSAGSRLNVLLGPLLLLGVTALVYSLNEPHLAFDGQTALLYSSLLVSIAVITYVVEGGEALMTHRRFGVPAGIRLVPIAIAIAAGFVLLSRLVHFDAPIMYGFIASATVLGAAGLEHKHAATAVVVPTIALLVVAIGAWLLLAPLRDATLHDGSWWAHVPSEAAAAIFVGGIEGLMFVLLPVRFTDGEKIFRWYRWLWFPLFGISAFLFCWVVLNPQAKAFDALLEGRVVFVACLVGIYAAVAGLIWAYFLVRRRGESHASVI